MIPQTMDIKEGEGKWGYTKRVRETLSVSIGTSV